VGGALTSRRTRDAAARAAASEPSVLDARTAAWLAAVPAAALALVAIVALGPALGDLLLPAPAGRLGTRAAAAARPEPTEQARFLIALSAPLLLSALTVALVRRPSAAPVRPALAARAAELLAVLIVAACFVAQRSQAPQTGGYETTPVVYFTPPSIGVAVAVAAALALMVRSARVRAGAARWLAETRPRRVAAALAAVAAVAVALLPAINTDSSIAQVFEPVSFHMQFTYDETMAVLNGRSPLGDFVAQYGALWPYALAAGMSVLGSGLAAFTGMLAALTGLALLAQYDILRRLTRSSIAALLLFLPLLATNGFRLHGPAVNRFSLINYSGVMPLRYAGPFLLAWLVVRHLDGARPRRAWALFLAAGLVVLNNTDFGLPALGATIAALAWTRRWPDAPGLRRTLLEAAGGLAAALALVTALLLARTGSPPDLSLLFRYARVFAIDGFAMLPIQPLFGVAIALFLTHVAAIGVATVRALRGERDALTGALAWSGVFGLGAGSYYVGHSLSEVLIYTFPPWALSLTLLTLVTLRALTARAGRGARPAELAVLVGFGLLVCSLAQTPAPWQQLRRIASHGPPQLARPLGETFVAQHTHRGEAVLIVALLGHRTAENLGLRDVEPYTGAKSIFSLEQLEDSVAALRAAGGRKLFVEPANAYEEPAAWLRGAFAPRAQGEGMQLWVLR
jgi:hypothetical protein